MSEHIFMTEVVQPVLIKSGDLFLTCRNDGAVDVGCGSGLGLFHRDTRYISRWALRIGGARLLTLMASSARGAQSVHEMTNDTATQLGGRPLEMQSLGVRLERTVDGEAGTLTDRFVIRNFSSEPVRFEARLLIDARFEDIFELRGATGARRGPTRRVARSLGGLTFVYRGADEVRRRLTLGASRADGFEARREGWAVTSAFALDIQESQAFTVTYTVEEAGAPRPTHAPRPPFYAGVAIDSDDAVLNAVADRSLRDLAMLRTGLGENFIAGGLPWFVSPFGRDSILAALQTLVFDPRPAEGVARLFAAYQGKAHDAATGEQPGKIHHELRLGAMARLEEVPHRPSYGSVDSTALFLILIGRHARWTGAPTLLRELRGAADAALAWIDGDGDSDGDGYLDYAGETADGPVNQGWKDSSGGVPRPDGAAPTPPIALCEVQGYAYLAKRLIAEALRADGDEAAASVLEAQAADLRERFNRDFWMEDEGCFALALEAGGRQVGVVTSNAGQVLWSGIADADKAARTAERLMRPDMNSGWGIRTLSELARAYNPLNYHLGCVWPFDNALIVEGLRRYGLDRAALEIVDDTLAAAGCFSLGRLPEFYVGFAREPDLFPARCPFAEPLQAWSAGAAPAMIVSLLGLTRDGTAPRFERPLLPSGVSRLTCRGLVFDGARLDVSARRAADGGVEAWVVTEASAAA